MSQCLTLRARTVARLKRLRCSVASLLCAPPSGQNRFLSRFQSDFNRRLAASLHRSSSRAHARARSGGRPSSGHYSAASAPDKGAQAPFVSPGSHALQGMVEDLSGQVCSHVHAERSSSRSNHNKIFGWQDSVESKCCAVYAKFWSNLSVGNVPL